MRFSFLTYLLALVLAAFGITIGISRLLFVSSSEITSQQMMSTKLNDLMHQLRNAETYVSAVQNITDISATERTRAIAEIIRLNPEIVKQKSKLQELCNNLSVKKIYLSDATGHLVLTLPEEEVTHLNAFEFGDEFMSCINAPGKEICRRPSAIAGSRSSNAQYVALPRLDDKGVLVCYFHGPREQRIRKNLTYSELSHSYSVGKGGYIIAFKKGVMLGNEVPPFPTADLLSMPLNKPTRMELGNSEYFTYAIRDHDLHLVGLLPVDELKGRSLNSLYRVLGIYALLFVAIFAVVFLLLDRLVIRNISRINASLRKITQGDLSVRLDAQDAPSEFRRLAGSINSMVDALQTTGKRNEESNQRELDLARTIQDTIIPNTFPAFPLQTEFDIYATCRQAKIVGGGFYDFFMQGDNYLCFMVADVSGNGVPAALFVLHSMSIIRELAHSGATPIDLVTRTNQALCDKRFVNMYMSLFYGVLEVKTGKLVYVNAGPPQALLQHRGQKFERVEMFSGTELGRTPNAVYTTCSTQLTSGDRLFLYTEGAVYATNPEMNEFGESRLYEAINSVTSHSIADVPRRVSAAHRKFTKGSEQTKDITMLALEYIGKKRSQVACSVFSAETDKMDHFIATHLESVLASPLAISELQQSVRRIGTELPNDTQMLLHMDFDEEVAEVSISYPKPAFNPLLHLSELKVDRTEYISDENGNNIINLWKKIA